MARKSSVVTLNDLEYINLRGDNLLNKCNVFYGSTDTGKSFLIRHTAKLLEGLVSQVIIFSTSEDFDNDVPRMYIQRDLSNLRAIYDRQVKLAELYKAINNEKVIDSLLQKADDPEIDRKIQLCVEFKNKKFAQIDRLDHLTEMEKEKCKKQIRRDVSKRILTEKKAAIKAAMNKICTRPLSEEEEFTLDNIDFNPHLLLILDDMTTELKKCADKDIINNLFFKGRHMFSTAFISAHSFKFIEGEKVDSTKHSFFTTEGALESVMKSPRNHFQEVVKKVGISIAENCKISELLDKVVLDHSQGKFSKIRAKEVDRLNLQDPILIKVAEEINNVNSATNNIKNYKRLFT